MKFIGGPWDGQRNDANVEVLEGKIVDAPTRVKIGSRWASVSHLYDVSGNSVATYLRSEFEWKPGMEDG